MILWRAIIASIAVTSLVGCSVDPLQKYMKDYGYSAFNPPRERDGVGTIVDFRDGFESVVASADPPDGRCATEANVPTGGKNDIATLDTTYSINRSSTLEINIAKGLIQGVDIGGAFEDERVRSVSIRLKQPYSKRISRDALSHYLSSTPPEDPCQRYLADKRNFIISSVVGAGGVEYEFQDKNNDKINVDTALAEKLKLSGTTRQQYEGSSSLIVDFPVLLGYRLWKVTETAGLVSGQVNIDDISPGEIEAFRNKSR
jgi:hypothetical protein